MSELMSFNFDNNKITAVIYDGKPAFVAMDVARALGYATPQKAISDHCKSLIKIKCSEMEHLGFTPIPQGVTLIHESDVYRLVMRSKIESAERFQDWVCEEVLPALRENGHYGFKPALPDFTDSVAAARAWADEVEQKRYVIRELVPYSKRKGEQGCYRRADKRIQLPARPDLKQRIQDSEQLNHSAGIDRCKQRITDRREYQRRHKQLMPARKNRK